ncbi:cellulose binding domain-containing protein [Micromonospora sp. NPDC050417]|uniref:cellulose binding domain-containing protein n=1 Tax=Micromonospora sp. NPDC050417 TaxID=3364280 RepID=UPI003795DFD8
MNPDEQTGDLRLGSPDRPPGGVETRLTEPPQPVRKGPPRTVAVAILDTVLDAAAAVRHLFTPAADRTGEAARKAPGSPLGRWPIGVGFVAGAAAVLGALVLLIALVLRTPERATPLHVAPPAEQGVGGTAGPGTPGSDASPAAVRTGQPEAQPAPPVPPAGADTPGAPASGATPIAPPPAVPLTASYTIEDPALLGYRMTVTVDNPGRAPVARWTVTITLPRAPMSVRDVTGAEATQAGTTWTFVPTADAGPTPAGGSVSFQFRVDGVGLDSAPTACTIDTRPCATP